MNFWVGFASALYLLSAGCVTVSYDDLASRELKDVEPGKVYRIGVSGVCGKVKDDHILVTDVIPGSPAAGKVKKGDKVRALQYRSVGSGAEGIRATVEKRIYRLGRDWDWHLYMTVERPSLRNGEGNTLTFDMRMPHDPDGQYHFGPTGFFGKIAKDHLVVDAVVKGSPSDGKLEVGDHITAVYGKPIKDDVFALFTEAVDKAESAAAGGKLELTILRPASVSTNEPVNMPVHAQQVTLQLEVLGSYSETAPIECPKTDAIITKTADGIVSRGSAPKGGYGRIGTSLIALLATGEKKYIDHVGKVLHSSDWAKPDVELPITGGSVSWHRAYRLITMCEYFLLTGDDYVLPSIRTHANTVARGQDAAGLWNHQASSPDANFGQLHGRLYGYGAINQTSIALWIGLILSEECGVKDPEVRMAVDKTYKLYSYWIGRGKLPYGNHGAGEDFFTNNGTSGSVAVGFGLLGDKQGASFFSRMSAAAGREILTGHTGPWFNIMWSGIGANVGGPELLKAHSRQVHWLRTVTRTWDNRFHHMEAWGCNPKDFGLGSSGSTLLNLAAGRRKIRITGRGMDESIWLGREEAEAMVAAGNIDYAALSIDELVELLGHPLPPVRTRASEMLAIKDAQIEERVLKLLSEGTRDQRIGALKAIGALKIAAEDELMAIVKDTKDDLWIRQLVLRQMVLLDGADKYAPVLLAMLAGDKDYDVQGRFDEDLGQALVRITKSDPYAAGLDKGLFYKAVGKLLDHKRQEARSAGMSLLKKIPLEDLHLIADKMIYVIKDTDRTYVSYHGDGHRQDGLDILYGLNIDESLDLTLNTINEKVGRGWRARNRKAFMKTWGGEAKRVIPRITEVLGEKEAPEYIKIIEDAQTKKQMISLEEALKAGEKADPGGGKLKGSNLSAENQASVSDDDKTNDSDDDGVRE